MSGGTGDKPATFWQAAELAMKSLSQSDPSIKAVLNAKTKSCGAELEKDISFIKSFQVTKAIIKDPKDTSWMDLQDKKNVECMTKAEKETKELFKGPIAELDFCKELCLQKFPSMGQIVSKTQCKRVCEDDYRTQCRNISNSYFTEYDENGKKRDHPRPSREEL